jgi:hypothetical protein
MHHHASRAGRDALADQIRALTTEITMVRFELAGRPANVKRYFDYSQQYEALRQASQAIGLDVVLGPESHALDTLLHAVKDLGRATTSLDPETEFVVPED